MISDILHNHCIVSQNGNKTHFKPYYLVRRASQPNSNMHIVYSIMYVIVWVRDISDGILYTSATHTPHFQKVLSDVSRT